MRKCKCELADLAITFDVDTVLHSRRRGTLGDLLYHESVKRTWIWTRIWEWLWGPSELHLNFSAEHGASFFCWMIVNYYGEYAMNSRTAYEWMSLWGKEKMKDWNITYDDLECAGAKRIPRKEEEVVETGEEEEMSEEESKEGDGESEGEDEVVAGEDVMEEEKEDQVEVKEGEKMEVKEEEVKEEKMEVKKEEGSEVVSVADRMEASVL